MACSLVNNVQTKCRHKDTCKDLVEISPLSRGLPHSILGSRTMILAQTQVRYYSFFVGYRRRKERQI
jgi:hypothetical protein